jgi:hypothetical protein
MRKMTKEEVINYIEKMISDYKTILQSEDKNGLSEDEAKFIENEIVVFENLLFMIF